MTRIKLADFDDERLKALLTRHLEGMHANSPPGHVFALDWSGLQKPEVSFSGVGFEPALALYRKRGFTNGGAFGSYLKSEFNQFLNLDLASTDAGARRVRGSTRE